MLTFCRVKGHLWHRKRVPFVSSMWRLSRRKVVSSLSGACLFPSRHKGNVAVDEPSDQGGQQVNQQEGNAYLVIRTLISEVKVIQQSARQEGNAATKEIVDDGMGACPFYQRMVTNALAKICHEQNADDGIDEEDKVIADMDRPDEQRYMVLEYRYLDADERDAQDDEADG